MELLNEAHEFRKMATRVRRLAKGLSQNAAQERMLRHAMELEADARSLERHAAEVDPATRPGTSRGGRPSPPFCE